MILHVFKIEAQRSPYNQHIRAIQKNKPRAVSKISKLLDEIREHPRTGTGQAEQLKGYDGSVYSRRITKEHRLVYKILHLRFSRLNLLSLEV